MGPVLLESVYEDMPCHELHLRRVPICQTTDLRLDLLIAGKVIVDLKLTFMLNCYVMEFVKCE